MSETERKLWKVIARKGGKLKIQEFFMEAMEIANFIPSPWEFFPGNDDKIPGPRIITAADPLDDPLNEQFYDWHKSNLASLPQDQLVKGLLKLSETTMAGFVWNDFERLVDEFLAKQVS